MPGRMTMPFGLLFGLHFISLVCPLFDFLLRWFAFDVGHVAIGSSSSAVEVKVIRAAPLGLALWRRMKGAGMYVCQCLSVSVSNVVVVVVVLSVG